MKIVNSNQEFIFVIAGDNEEIEELRASKKQAVFISEDIYNDVTKMISGMHRHILSKRESFDEKQNVEYWEKGWHDKIVNFIVDLTGFDRIDVSNSLSAYWGY
jgi:hypothetical protein